MERKVIIRPAFGFGLLGFVLHAAVGSSNADDAVFERALTDESHQLFSVEPEYIGEVFTNARGGKSTNDATQYQGLLNIGLELDLTKDRDSRFGKLFLLAQNTHGRGLTEDFIGDTQTISNIDSFNNIMQVGEYWWESRWLEDDITLRLGKQDYNSEFQHIAFAEDFIQSTFGLSPSTAFPTYPNQSVGAVVLLQLLESVVLKTGVWNAFVSGSSWGFSPTDSFLVAGEIEKSFALRDDSLRGQIAIGIVYESAGEIETQPVSPVHEYYVQFEQMIYRESLRDNRAVQGCSLFAGYYPRFPGPSPVEKSIGDSVVAGITYRGLLAGRDDDVVGTGIAWAELFGGGTNQETVTEVFYRAELNDRMSFQPDFQYIKSPSGIFRDAMAVGCRFILTPR